MQARMSNPATILPDVTDGIQALLKATRKGGVPQAVLELVHLRASQINGCSFCVDLGARSARRAGETDQRGLAALILMIATTNLFNRLNATTRQVAGSQGW
jgi:AhpD family alkylhydroperoxidase